MSFLTRLGLRSSKKGDMPSDERNGKSKEGSLLGRRRKRMQSDTATEPPSTSAEHDKAETEDYETVEHLIEEKPKVPMSRDRVEFKFGVNTYGGVDRSTGKTQYTASAKAANVALGMSGSEFRDVVTADRKIRCRPSQFARFIILRAEYGGQNQMACLEAKLIPGVSVPEFVDVSDRPAVNPGDRRDFM